MLHHLKQGFIFAGVIGIPLLYLFNILFIYAHQNTMTISPLFRLGGIVSATAGLILWIISMATLNKSFGVLPQKQKRITRGVYKYVKHPMYVGIWLAFTGMSIASQSWGGLVFTFVIMVPLLLIRAYFEDKALK